MNAPAGDPANLYAPPQAEVREIEAAAGDPFYVVARGKFLLLYFATIGLYQVYWFYRHWAAQRRHRGTRTVPVLRALFAIFFTHSLFQRIDASLDADGQAVRWHPRWAATAFVLLSLLSYVLSQLVGKSIGWPVTDVLNLLIIVPVAWPLWIAQRAANLACADPAGARNAALTVPNGLWLALGVLLWAAALFSLTLSPEDLA